MTQDDRLALALDHFGRAVDALALALAQNEDEFIRDSIIKRFELCFETARKAMQRWLLAQQEITEQATKREVMQAALRTGLIDDPDLWDALGAARNDTSHEYDRNQAIAHAAMVRARAMAAFQALRQALATR